MHIVIVKKLCIQMIFIVLMDATIILKLRQYLIMENAYANFEIFFRILYFIILFKKIFYEFKGF